MTSCIKWLVYPLRRLGLHGRLMLGLFAMMLVVGGIGGYALTRHEEEIHFAELESRTARISDFLSLAIAPLLRNGDKPSIDALINSLAGNPEVDEFTVTTVQGGVISSVKPHPSTHPMGEIVRVTGIYHAGPDGADRERLGSIKVVMSTDIVRAEIRHAQTILLTTFFVLLAGLHIVTLYLLKWMVRRPIDPLSRKVDRIALGDLSVTGSVGTRGQLAMFAARVDIMVRNVGATISSLRASETKYRRIFENSSEGIFRLDRNGQLLDVNPAMVRLFDYPSADQLKQASLGGYAQRRLFSAEQISELFANASAHNGVVACEMELRKLHGERIWVELNARAIVNSSGSVEFLEGMISNITERRRAHQRLLMHRERLAGEVSERRRAEANLRASKKRLRELAEYMESIREEERKQIALTIHDELGQMLTILKINLGLLGRIAPVSEQQAQKIVEMASLVDKTVRIVRDVASHLRPAALNYGLASALEWLAAEFSRHELMTCRFLLIGEEPALDEPRATAVFRVAQEALTNIMRHANATHVELRMADLGAAYELSIADNGQGFEMKTQSQRTTYGLLGMQERARALGAEIEIDSAAGTGTVVRVVLPKALNVSQRADFAW
ncbi:PAS domain S-box protein [Burkholderia sp. RS02]|uniref:PAS domain-containing sensor histidine kinase n=1 Tax=unclassified Burkholderia TaxID=2613784 RepID=UPI003218C1C0